MNLFGHDLLAMMASHGYLLLFVIILLEEAGLPLPIPGDLLLLFAGSMVAQGVLGLAPALIVVTVATLAGTSLLYTVGLRGGRPLLHRYGRWLRIKEERIARAERWLGQRPLSGVALLRLTPGLRIYSTLVAGLLAVPRRRATISFVGSGFVWAAAWLAAGMALGSNVNRAAAAISKVDGLILPIIAVAVAGVALFLSARWVYRRTRRDGLWAEFRVRRAARIAGRPRLGSTAISGVALAVLLVMPPVVGTLHSFDEHVERPSVTQQVIAQVPHMALRHDR